MARVNKTGLDYFPHDTDASSDEKLRLLEAEYGPTGYAFYFKTLERIYRNNGEYILSESAVILFARDLHITKKKLEEIAAKAVELGLFSDVNWRTLKKMKSDAVDRRIDSINHRKQRTAKSDEFQQDGDETTRNNPAVIPQEPRETPSNEGESKSKSKRKEKENAAAREASPPEGMEAKSREQQIAEDAYAEQDGIFDFLNRKLHLSVSRLYQISQNYTMEYIAEKARLTQRRFKTLENPQAFFAQALTQNFQDFQTGKDIALEEKKAEAERLMTERIATAEKILAAGGKIEDADYRILPEDRKRDLFWDEDHYLKTKKWVFFDPKARSQANA